MKPDILDDEVSAKKTGADIPRRSLTDSSPEAAMHPLTLRLR
jgi:hypothetical protein